MSHKITISKKFEFSASHRYWVESWTEEKNKRIFGQATSLYGHGHNYELHVTVAGRIDPQTGMIINLSHLKQDVNTILEQFDHKFLNLDTPWFKDLQPSTENIARVLFDLIDERLSENPHLELRRVRLYERQDIYSDVWKDGGK